MTTDIETLEAKAQKARAAYEQAQTAAAQARQRELEHQAERAHQIDEETLAAYSDAANVQAVEDAKQQLVRAIADSDIGQAWVGYQLAQLRHAHAAVEANGVANRLGQRPFPNRPAPNVAADLLPLTIDRVAGDLIASELAERDAAREARIRAED